MAQDRTLVEEAWPGDIIGIHNHGTIKIGDTFSEKEPLKFIGIPNFAPEHFRRVRLKSATQSEAAEEGVGPAGRGRRGAGLPSAPRERDSSSEPSGCSSSM